MMEKDSGQPIQAMPLGRGNASSPYAVLATDTVVEFGDNGDAMTTFIGGATTTTTVLAGSRYSIANGIATITFDSNFSVG